MDSSVVLEEVILSQNFKRLPRDEMETVDRRIGAARACQCRFKRVNGFRFRVDSSASKDMISNTISFGSFSDIRELYDGRETV